MKKIVINLSDDQHMNARVYALKNNTTIQKMFGQVVEDHLNKLLVVKVQTHIEVVNEQVKVVESIPLKPVNPFSEILNKVKST